MGLGFVFGPALGGLLARSSPTTPFLLAGALSGVNLVLAWLILDEPLAAGERTKARALTWDGLVRTVSTPKLAVLMALFFIVTFGFANLEGTFALYLERQFGYGRKETSWLFAYIGVLMIFTQGLLVRRLAPRLGERRLVIAGTLLMGVGFYLMWTADTGQFLFAAITVVAVGNGLNTPSLSSLISRAATASQQGGVLGVSQAFGALARVVGPLVGTWSLGFATTTPYVIGGTTLLAACLFASALVAQPRLRPAEATGSLEGEP
jgi:MFS family permease